MPPRLITKPLNPLRTLHKRTPLLRALPFPALAIITLLILINILVWIAVGIILHYEPDLISTAVLSWILGLRHALDADHIAAIDLMTRRLLVGVGVKEERRGVCAGDEEEAVVVDGAQVEGGAGGGMMPSKKKSLPVTVGTFFSLGHSTIVIITSIIVAATAAAVSSRFEDFSRVGAIIGSSVSAAFLVLLGVVNVWILGRLWRQMKEELRRSESGEDGGSGGLLETSFKGGGCMFALFRRVFRIIDRPWKMYPLGILFGLGFDTSSEIALLGISSIQASRGTSIWLILIFPLLFTAGMCLIDTIDGALMMSLYTSATLARDSIAILYYSIVLTGVTVVVALFIGVVQALIMADAIVAPEEPIGAFWEGVEALGDRYDIVGGCICGTFVVVGLLSVVFYRPWRRRIDRRRRNLPDEGGIQLESATSRADTGIEEVISNVQTGGLAAKGEIIVSTRPLSIR